jgi:hypothetical protein
MDHDRFDRLATMLATVGTRRGLLQLLPLAGGLGALNLADAPAKKPKRKKKKKCATAGLTTSKKRKTCCAGLAKNASGRCAQPASSCTPAACLPSACGSMPDGCGGTLSCGGCAGNSLCHGGVCRPCDVTCLSGDPDICGEDLQAALDDGGTLYVCPGRYRGNFSITTNASVTGAGDGAAVGANTILEGTGTTSVVTIAQETSVNLQRLRITGGAAASFFGGGIFNDRGTLTVTDCTVTGNTSAGNGGGIDNSFGTLTLTGCTVTKNAAAFRGGGIGNSGTLTLNGSIVSGNTATDFAGGIFAYSGTVTLDAASRVTGNDAKPTNPDSGGGIYKNVDSTVTLSSGDNVSGNTPDNCGGAPVPLCVG